ncbi:MAG: response regulator transcription factor [Pseudomonadota bacterium]
MKEHSLSHNTSIVIADDHQMVREGLSQLFASMRGTEIVGVAENGLEAIALCRKHRPRLLTLDVGMPLANGAEVFAEVRAWSPETAIAVFTGFTSVGMLADWVTAGVEGLFLKTCCESELRRGLELIMVGKNYVDQEIVRLLAEAPDGRNLTPREREVLSLIADGLTSTQIGDRLCISPKTIEKHRASLFEKFETKSVGALLSAAFKEGLLDHLGQT